MNYHLYLTAPCKNTQGAEPVVSGLFANCLRLALIQDFPDCCLVDQLACGLLPAEHADDTDRIPGGGPVYGMFACESGRTFVCCFLCLLHRLPLSFCKASGPENGNRERVSCFRSRGRFCQFMLTIEWMSLISSRRFMYSSTRIRGWPSRS